MADNVQLNPGSGGAELTTLQHGDGSHTPRSALVFATTLAPGANVVQIVDADHGLPVELVGAVDLDVVQANETALNATVFQGGPWVAQFAPGQTVGIAGTVEVAQSGAWSVGLKPGAEVALAAGATVGVAGTVAATQSGTWTVDLESGTAVTVSGTVAATQSGTWSVAQATAANLNATVTQAGPVTVQQSTAASLKTEATLASGSAVALNAGTALIGKTAAGADGSTIYDGTTALSPTPAAINVAASGNNQIVAAVSGKKIRVIQWSFTAHGEVVAEWRSGTTTVVSGPRPLIKYASAGGAPSQWGRFETAVGEALNLNLSDAIRVGGELSYVLV